MKKARYLLGIDIGTSSAKALVMDRHGITVAAASVDYDISTPLPGYAEQDAEMLKQAAFAAIKDAVTQAGGGDTILAAGFTGQMHGLVCLDSGGRPLRPVIIWADQRSTEQLAFLREIGAEAVAMNPASTGFLLPSLLWVRQHEPEVFSKLRSVLFPKDYVRFCMTGIQSTDYSDASGALLMNPRTFRWDEDICKACHIGSELLPPIQASTEIAGQVTVSAARETGLQPGTPVICGGGDTPMLMTGNGLLTAGQLSTNIGTASQINCICAKPPEAWDKLNVFHHTDKNLWIAAGASLNGGIVLKWARDSLLGGTLSFSEMDALAEASVPGSNGVVLLPFLCGERAPYLDPHAKAVLFGMKLSTIRADIVRSVLESVVFAFRDCMEVFAELELPLSDCIVASGGGTKSPIWLQMQADILKKKICVRNAAVEAAKGAALAAGVGVGIYSSLAQAAEITVPAAETIYTPNPENYHVYDQRFRTYRMLYHNNRNLF